MGAGAEGARHPPGSAVSTVVVIVVFRPSWSVSTAVSWDDGATGPRNLSSRSNLAGPAVPFGRVGGADSWGDDRAWPEISSGTTTHRLPVVADAAGASLRPGGGHSAPCIPLPGTNVTQMTGRRV